MCVECKILVIGIMLYNTLDKKKKIGAGSDSRGQLLPLQNCRIPLLLFTKR